MVIIPNIAGGTCAARSCNSHGPHIRCGSSPLCTAPVVGRPCRSPWRICPAGVPIGRCYACPAGRSWSSHGQSRMCRSRSMCSMCSTHSIRTDRHPSPATAPVVGRRCPIARSCSSHGRCGRNLTCTAPVVGHRCWAAPVPGIHPRPIRVVPPRHCGDTRKCLLEMLMLSQMRSDEGTYLSPIAAECAPAVILATFSSVSSDFDCFATIPTIF